MKDQNDESTLENVSIVKEFTFVFPEDLSDLPPNCEIEFMIDLVLGTRLISIYPYRMELAKLCKLKVQL